VELEATQQQRIGIGNLFLRSVPSESSPYSVWALHAAESERLIKQLQHARDQYNCICFFLRFTCLIRNYFLNISGNFYLYSLCY